MKSRLHALGLAFVVVAGLLSSAHAAQAFGLPPAMPPVAVLVHTVDHAVQKAEAKVDAQYTQSTAALATAVREMPVLSLQHKEQLLRCIDQHLTCTRQDLVAAMAARENSIDDRLAPLYEVEIREYRETRDLLVGLRVLVASS